MQVTTELYIEALDRYNRFATNLLFRDLTFRQGAVASSDRVPAFELITIRGERLVNDDLFGDKPALFVFGSMTCPMTASSAPSVQELYEEFGERVDFIMMYVREAHPGENYSQAESMDDKIASVTALPEFYGIGWTVVADTLDGDLLTELAFGCSAWLSAVTHHPPFSIL